MSDGWLDPWGKQHEVLCGQYMSDEAVMGTCACGLIQRVILAERKGFAAVEERIRELHKPVTSSSRYSFTTNSAFCEHCTESGTYDYSGEVTDYPCETIQALEGDGS